MSVAETALGPPHDRAALRRMWFHGLFAFALSRIFVLAGASAVAVFKAKADPDSAVKQATATKDTLRVLTGWDSEWYLRIAQHGYPRYIPPGITYFQDEARTAFFPLYPRLVHLLDPLLPGGAKGSALIVAWVAGLVAVILIGLLACQIYGPRVGARAMILVSLFPGSFVLAYAYSESVLLVLAAACLLFLHRRNWLLAGLAAALATAARPNAIALCLACAVAAFFAIRDRRDWWSLAAPLLSPIGYISFQLFLAHHTGERGAWFRVQREAWDEGFSLGTTAMRGVWNALIHPVSSPGNTITLFTMVTMVGLVWASSKVKLPAAWWAYSAGILFLMMLPNTVAPRPRFLITAFPLFIGLAAWWPDEDRDWWAYTLAAFSAALVAIVAVYGGLGAIP